MKSNILFKDDGFIYMLKDNTLTMKKMQTDDIILYNSVTHLDSVKPLFMYHLKRDQIKFDVYYEHGQKFIGKVGDFYNIFLCTSEYTKDYTLINLNLL